VGPISVAIAWLTWDGSYKTLYFDGTEVAKDAKPQAHLKAAHSMRHENRDFLKRESK
jgi:hypothetical protein